MRVFVHDLLSTIINITVLYIVLSLTIFYIVSSIPIETLGTVTRKLALEFGGYTFWNCSTACVIIILCFIVKMCLF